MKLKSIIACCAAAASLCGAAAPAQAGEGDYYVGEVLLVAGDFCPKDTLSAKGQLLAANKYQTLFSVLGNRFGGTAPDTFKLPNLTAPTGNLYCIVVDGLYPQRS